MQEVMKKYSGKVNWVFRQFPLTSLHPTAFAKAQAAECVGNLGNNDKFWQFLDKLFADQSVTPDKLPDLAASLGIDKTKFQDCVKSTKYDQKIKDQSAQAVAAGGQGTPYSVIVVGDTRTPIPGAIPLEQLTPQLDALLK
jgi:protein-disulfide isomerase